jgi:AraC-like DNA-binding protein
MRCLTPAYRPWILGCGPLSRVAGAVDGGTGYATWFLHSATGGGLVATIDGVPVTVVDGGCFLVPPGRPFSFTGAATGGLWCHVAVVWSADGERTLARCRGDFHLHGPAAPLRQPGAEEVWGVDLPPVLSAGDQRRAAAWLAEAHHHWRSGRPERLLQAHALADRILTAWAAAAWRRRDPLAPEAEERIARAEAIALQRLADPGFGVAEMAAAVGWGRQHFAEVYHRERGVTPSAFLRRARIDEACTRLRIWPRSAAAIGASVGYPQPAAFLRAFRAVTGTTPDRWRRAGR